MAPTVIQTTKRREALSFPHCKIAGIEFLPAPETDCIGQEFLTKPDACQCRMSHINVMCVQGRSVFAPRVGTGLE